MAIKRFASAFSLLFARGICFIAASLLYPDRLNCVLLFATFKLINFVTMAKCEPTNTGPISCRNTPFRGLQFVKSRRASVCVCARRATHTQDNRWVYLICATCLFIFENIRARDTIIHQLMNLMYNYINDIEMETADIYILSRDENQFKMSERENKQRAQWWRQGMGKK